MADQSTKPFLNYSNIKPTFSQVCIGRDNKKLMRLQSLGFTWNLTSHFKDESFRAINCTVRTVTVSDNQHHNNVTKIHKKHRKIPPPNWP